TEAGSVADYRLRQAGHLRRLYRNQLATLNALSDKDIDFAYLWANVGWTLHTSPEFALELVPDYVPEDHWNIAIAMCKGDDELKAHVDQALEGLIRDGAVGRALARYHVPHFSPFTDPVHSARDDDAQTIVHEVASRGREPQMEKIQKSKHGYSGMERIRS